MQPCTKLGSAAARRLGTIGRALVTARSPQARHALAMAHSTAAEASPHQSSMGTVVTVAAVEKPEAFSPDCIVLVSPFMAPLDASTTYGFLEPLLAAGAEIDNRVRISVALVPLPDRPFGCPRLVASPATLHSWDPTDIRGFAAAAQAGVNVACAAGAERPLLVVDGDHDAALVAGVAASEAWYVPLEAREAGRSNGNLAAVTLGLAMCKGPVPKGIPARASAAALGLTLSRDICGGSPERMTPLKTAAMVEAAFADTPVVVEVVSGREALEEHYPLLAAVDRGSAPRHAGCVVKLSYRGQQATRSTFLVGKGVAMDTGGVNLKSNGGGGMTRDKGGAAAVAGFMLAVATLRPSDQAFTAYLCMVRNSIGSDAFVPDEVVVSRAGQRVLVVNTDAEGRFAMADALCQAREEALRDAATAHPQLLTVATLTGHAALTYGSGYSCVVANGVARQRGLDTELEVAGDAVGDPVEVSRLRPEDYEFIFAGTSAAEDIRQNGPGSSAVTPRGHQFPAAFLVRASGLGENDLGADREIAYRHIDMAGAAGGAPSNPTGRPLMALMKDAGLLDV